MVQLFLESNLEQIVSISIELESRCIVRSVVFRCCVLLAYSYFNRFGLFAVAVFLPAEERPRPLGVTDARP